MRQITNITNMTYSETAEYVIDCGGTTSGNCAAVKGNVLEFRQAT